MRAVSFALALALAVPSAAAQIQLDLDPQAAQALATELGVDVPRIQEKLESAMNEAFYEVAPERSLGAFAEAAVLSGKGLGVDYAPADNLATAGVAGSFAGAIATGPSGNVGGAGVGVNISVMAGMNVARLAKNPRLSRVNAYISGFYFSKRFGPLDATIASAALHGQVNLVSGRGGRWARWGGLDYTGGLELSRSGVTLGGTLETALPIDEDEEKEITLRSQGRFTLRTTTVTFSSELSTSVRLVYALSLYGGLGVDVMTGQTEVHANLSGALQSGAMPAGNAMIRTDGTGYPSGLQKRYLFGLQANVWRFRLFTQLNVVGGEALGLALGARYSW